MTKELPSMIHLLEVYNSRDKNASKVRPSLTKSQVDTNRSKFANLNERTNLRRRVAPNGFVSGLANSSHKPQEVVNFTRMQMDCYQLMSTCVEWPKGEKLASTELLANMSSTAKLNSRRRKWVAKWKAKLALTCIWPGHNIGFSLRRLNEGSQWCLQTAVYTLVGKLVLSILVKTKLDMQAKQMN